MRIAILGTRGIPGRYGGFETFAEELATRLDQRGHDVTVYCRPKQGSPRPPHYRGVRLVYLPALRTKYLETLSHTLLSALHTLSRRYDIVYVCNSANSPICLIPWLSRQRTILNVDGLEWRRRKWNGVGRLYYRWAAWLAAHLPIEIVTDARVIQSFYLQAYRRETAFYPYGTELHDRGEHAERLEQMGLSRGRYLLYVSRMEPENNALLVVEAYRSVHTDMPLVMVGDAPYASDYIADVKRRADGRVVFLGYRFGADYHALQANAYLYVQATEVGGTHPALVEAMGHGNAIVAHEVPEHREVLGDAGEYFRTRDKNDLTAQVDRLLHQPDRVEELRRRAAERAEELFSWDSVTREYEEYFTRNGSQP